MNSDEHGHLAPPTAGELWEARAAGLLDSIHEAWRRGVGFTGLFGFDRTKPAGPQEDAFNRRFLPWLDEVSTPSPDTTTLAGLTAEIERLKRRLKALEPCPAQPWQPPHRWGMQSPPDGPRNLCLECGLVRHA